MEKDSEESILHSSSSSSNASSVLGFTAPFQVFSINGVDSTKTDKEEQYWWIWSLSLYNGRSLISLQVIW